MRFLDAPIHGDPSPTSSLFAATHDDVEQLEAAIAAQEAVAVATFVAHRAERHAADCRLDGHAVDVGRATLRTLDLALDRVRSPTFRPPARPRLLARVGAFLRYWLEGF